MARGRPCKVCNHPERKIIEKKILSLVPLEKIAAEHGFKNRHSVGNHKAAGHIKAYLETAEIIKDVYRVEFLLKPLNEAEEVALDIMRNSKKEFTRLAAIDRLAKVLELKARLMGQIDESIHVDNRTVKVIYLNDWRNATDDQIEAGEAGQAPLALAAPSTDPEAP